MKRSALTYLAGFFSCGLALMLVALTLLQLIEAGCCGMAGSFGYEKEHYEVSQQIGDDRLFPAIRQRGEAAVIACGFSCRHQVTDATGVEAKHWVEMIKVEGPGTRVED